MEAKILHKEDKESTYHTNLRMYYTIYPNPINVFLTTSKGSLFRITENENGVLKIKKIEGKKDEISIVSQTLYEIDIR